MKMMKLSSLGTLRNGMNYDKSSAVCGCKIIGVADFGNRVFPDYDSLSEIDSSIVTKDDLLQNGDIVFVRSNGNKNLVGRTMFIHDIKDPVCYSGFCIAFRPNTDLVYPEYLFYVLRAPFCKKQYGYSQQTNITNLSQGVLGDVDVPVPDLDTQQKLAKILSEIDLKIISNTRICVELEAMAKTLYDYWFTQFDFPNAEGKPYRSSGGEMVWNDQLKRAIPKGWQVSSIGSVTRNYDSKRVPLSQNERDTMKGGIPYYGATGIMDYVNRHIFDGQYVLIAEDGSVMDAKGNPIVQMIWGKTWVNNHAHVLQGCNGYSNELLYLLLQHIPVVKIMTGSIQKKINQDNLNSYNIPQIPDPISQAFYEIVKPMFEKIQSLQDENDELTKLRDWLLPVLMNGQATVE